MSEEKKLDILDYFIVLIKWKKFIVIFMFFSLLLTYLTIRFTIKEQYDSQALIIPSEDNSVSGLAGLLSDFDPFSMGFGGGASPEMGMYNTIIFSRSSLENVIKKFDIYRVYEVDTTGVEYKQNTLEMLSKSLSTEITDDGAFVIKARTINAQLSADIVNYVINMMNDRIIELRAKKSRLNRQFLGKRVAEVKAQLTAAEDSLKVFQEESGILSAEDQIRNILGVYSDLEVNLMAKETQLNILENVLSKNSSEVEALKMEVETYKKQFEKLKKSGNDSGTIVAMEDIPQAGLTYLRLYRNVQIQQQILQFVLPLYEQAKFDEQKDLPILQVIDYAEAPPKKSYPPRTVMSLAINIGIFILLTLYIFMKENEVVKGSEKFNFVKKNLFNFKSPEYKG